MYEKKFIETEAHNIYSLKNFQDGDHICALYTGEEEWEDSTVAFVSYAFERNYKVIMICSSHTVSYVADIVARHFPDKAPFEESQGVEILDANDAYLKFGGFCPHKMTLMLNEKYQEALNQGFNNLCVAGEVCWALDKLDNMEKLYEYEHIINDEFFAKTGAIALCQYNVQKFNPAVLCNVIDAHPICQVGCEIYPNQFYIPPKIYLSAEKDKQLLQQKLQQIKERKTQEQEIAKLYAQTEELKEFNYMVSHDLKSPIKSANSLLSLIKEEEKYKMSSVSQELVEKLQGCLSEAYNRIESLQDLAEISPLTENQELSDLNKIILSSIKYFSPHVEKIGGKIKYVPQPLPMIQVKKTHLTQVLNNLIENSVKYKRDDVPLIIQFECKVIDKIGIEVYYKDNGVGFMPTENNKIFRPFYRSSPNKAPGMGIGLTICQRIMQKYNGTISANGHPYEGAEFILFFPFDKGAQEMHILI